MAKIKNVSEDTYRGSGRVIKAGALAEVTDAEAEYLLSVFGDRFKRIGNEDPPGRSPRRKQVRGPKRKRG